MRPVLMQETTQMLACPSCQGYNPHFLGACLHCGRMLPDPQERGHFRLWLQSFAMTTVLLGLGAGLAFVLS